MITSLKKEVEKLKQKVTLIEDLCNWDLNLAEIDHAASPILQDAAPEAPGASELRLLLAKPYRHGEDGRGELQVVIGRESPRWRPA